MKKNNSIEARQKELAETGLCKTLDFKPENKTRIENYTFDFAMDKEARRLLEMAHRELSLVDGQLERIERITQAIMRVENKTTAEACHIAEAVQYVAV